ncbi:MAG TPA: c-type cytochrome [Burkholderiales bacterium]|nr:c-type cytochrome [Burkholderiales bacterium]
MGHPRATIFLLFLAAASPALAQFGGRGDAAKAQSTVTAVCAACHGVDGNSQVPTNPSLAGQHFSYIYKQLTDYKAGRRKNPIMNGIVANLSDEDMRDLAAYFSTQKPKPGAAKDRALVLAGQRLYRGGLSDTGVPACSACHSPDGAGIPAQYPRLAGQHLDYTLAQLQSFRSGARDNDPNAMMRTIAGRLTDKDMAALASYVSGLR